MADFVWTVAEFLRDRNDATGEEKEIVMPLSAYAEWSHLSQDDDDNREEVVLLQAAGSRASMVRGVVRYQYDPPSVKALQCNGLNLDKRLAETLLLKVWSHFSARSHWSASEIHWVISDIEPFLNQWFYVQDAKRIAQRMQSFSPSVIALPDIMEMVIG